MAQENENVVSTETANEVTPTESTSTEENKTAQENVVDNKVEDTDDDGEIEFDESDTADDDESSKNNENDSSKKQSREKNREYARKRREQQEREKHTSYLNGVKTALGDVNPFTNEKMESEEDVQTYLDMKEMEKKGLDPTSSTDYIKFMREKQKVELEQQEKQAQINNKMQTELLEFKTKYPTVDIENLIANNPSWNNLIISQVAQGKTLLQAYEMVNGLVQESVNQQANTIAEERVKKQIQNQLASAGSLTNGEEIVSHKVDWKNMPPEEFAKIMKEELDSIT